jgi:hypothetical protein
MIHYHAHKKACHWTLSWANQIQFTPLIPISLRSILMLSSHLCLGWLDCTYPAETPNIQSSNLVSFCNCLGCAKESVQVQGALKHLVTSYIFTVRWSLAPRPTPKLEDHPLSAVHDCLFNIFAAILHIWRVAVRTHHAMVTRDPPNMITFPYSVRKLTVLCRHSVSNLLENETVST